MHDGNYANGKLDGKGKLYNEEGVWIEGIFKDGTLTGKGQRYSEEGDLLYDGDWVDLVPEGYGKLIFDEDVVVYEGELKKGVPNGKGKQYLGGKIVKEGIFVDGNMVSGDKVIYVNSFKNMYIDSETLGWDNIIIVKLLKEIMN